MTIAVRDSEAALARRSKVTALVTLLGALLTLGALAYAFVELEALNKEIEEKRRTIDTLEEKIDDLTQTETGLLDFLAEVTRGDQIAILDPTVDWPAVRNHLIEMPAGKRKEVILIALLYAWKEIPFRLGGNTIRDGFDSPRFLQRVLSHVGVRFEASPGVRLSDSIMSGLNRTDAPLPGDLAFFRGQIGSFGFLLLTAGDDQSAAVGIGTLQEIAPLQVISLSNINTPSFPLIGYFHVPYDDED